jgi:positive regulator of sigma E activity
MLGYVFPFLVMLITLIVMTAAGFKESVAGLTAIAMLTPYYLALYLSGKNRSKSHFSFRLK